MDEINEQTENMKQIQDALSQPVGAMADIDDVRGLESVRGGEGDVIRLSLSTLDGVQDELLEELEELDALDLDEELLQPAMEQKLPSVPTQAPTVQATPATRTPVAVEEDDPDLEALRREMAM